MVCLPYYTEIEKPFNAIFFLGNITSAVISVSGNGIVIYVILTLKRLQKPTNWLLMALASADLLVGTVAQPLCGIYLVFFHSLSNCYIEKTIVFTSAMSCPTSVLILCLIAHDRYLHLSKGLAYNEHTSGIKISFHIFGSWIIGLVTAGTYMLNGPGYEQYLGFAVSAALISFSFIYISVTYFRIKKILQIHFQGTCDRQDDPINGRQVTSKTSMVSQRSKITAARLAREKSYNTTMLLIMSLFVIVWFPFMVILTIGTAYQIKGKTPGIWLPKGFMWAGCLTYVNGAINPFIYGIRYKEVGREMKNVMSKIFCFTPLSRIADEQNQDSLDNNMSHVVPQKKLHREAWI